MSLRQLLNQGQALLRRAAAEGAAGGTLQRSAFSTLPDDLATAALKARFPARRPLPSASSAAAADGAAAGVSPAAAAQQAAAKEVQVGALLPPLLLLLGSVLMHAVGKHSLECCCMHSLACCLLG